MLPSLLILSVSFQLAWTCLPMKPAEDMHCPSVPLASAVDGYAVNGLVKTIVNGAEVYSCAPPDKAMLIEVDGTNIKTFMGGKITCNPNSGIFVDDKNMAVNQKTYNCGSMFSCQKECEDKINSVFINVNAKVGPTDQNPYCIYTCETNTNVVVNGMRHDRVVCNSITGVFTADSMNGEMVTETNKFQCDTCQCDSSQTNDGNAGLCPPDKLCLKPTDASACMATCPPDSQALYKDLNGQLKESKNIQCPAGAMDWFADYDKVIGVTCQYDDGKGYTSTPPTGGQVCTPLEVLDCPTPNGCKSDEIIYVDDHNGGYSLMCKEGTLITDSNQNPEGDLILYCKPQSTFPTKANCLTGDNQVPACTTGVQPGIFNVKCAFGTCSITCKNAAQKFMYNLNPGPAGEKSPYLICGAGDLMDPTRNGFVDKPSVTCVP